MLSPLAVPNGSVIAARMRLAVRTASSVSRKVPSSTANSSPPSRAARSVSRRQARMRWAIPTSTASPTAWPWRSLMPLKSSLSR
ncbi:hypothetical protein D3C87_1501180 [compost metagenome]